MLSNAPRAIFNYGLQMIEIKKTVIVPYTAEKMFKLVSNIENYPKALPWCSKSKIKEQSGNEVIGPVFNYISKNIIDCFIKEARESHNK